TAPRRTFPCELVSIIRDYTAQRTSLSPTRGLARASPSILPAAAHPIAPWLRTRGQLQLAPLASCSKPRASPFVGAAPSSARLAPCIGPDVKLLRAPGNAVQS